MKRHKWVGKKTITSINIPFEQLCLINDLPSIEYVSKPRSPYQQWKLENNYRKANSENRCKDCKNLFVRQEKNKYYKCILLGLSGSSATDVRLSNVCNLFTPQNADCQLCKHLDCDTEGHFICGLDGEILDHEGIYCHKFVEYEE